LQFYLNGKLVDASGVDSRQTLLEYLRDTQLLTGTKRSCLQGGCGACLVMIERYDWATKQWVAKPVNSCLKPIAACDDTRITTVEGVGSERKGLHPVQERIAGNHGMQCGFCTPGMVMSAYAMLKEHGQPSAQVAMNSFDGNICRCTGYRNLVNVSESFASDAAPEIQALVASKQWSPCDAAAEKIRQSPPPAGGLSTKQFKFNDFTFYAPSSLTEVLELKKAMPRAPYVFGDTAKGIRSAAYSVFDGRAKDVIYIGNVRELNNLTESNGELIFGGALTIQHIVDALRTRAGKLPFANELADAMTCIAQRHLRSEAGWAGNLIITSTRGFPSDLFPSLIAADAKVSFITPSSDEKTISIEDLKPGVVPPNALLCKLHIPLTTKGTFRYYRVAQRKWLAHAFVNAAFRAVVDPKTKKVTEARVAVGAYAMGPKRSTKAEAAMIGSSLDSSALRSAIEGLHTEFDSEFISDSQYKTIDNPAGKDEYRKSLPDVYLFKFFQEAQAANGIKAWDASEIGTLATPPLKRGVLKFQELPGRADTQQLSSKGLTTGEVRYCDDTRAPALSGYLVLSECATGKLTKLDTSAALKAEGVVDIITAQDVPGANSCGFVPGEEFVFVPVGSDIMTTGQQLALVVATSYRLAKEAAGLVKIEIADKNKGAVTTIEQAIEAGSELAGGGCVDMINQGDVDGALKSSPNVIDGETRVIGQHGFAMEKNTAFAVPEERQGMTLYGSMQAPDFVRAVVAGVLGMKAGSMLQVRQQRAGGAFGTKNSRNVPVCAAAAVACNKLDKPVRIACEATQEQAACGGRHAFKVSYSVGFKDDGTFTALRVKAWGNGGCTHDFTGFLTLEVAEAIPSVYDWKNVKIDCHGMKLNLPSNTAVRSFGNPQAFFITETIVERVAAALGKPVEEIREKNMLTKSNAITPWGQQMEFYNADMLWNKLKNDARYTERQQDIEKFNREHRWRKRGISLVPLVYGHAYVYAAGSGALVNINGSDGSITVHHGGCEIGQGIHTKVAQVVALTLGAPLDCIRVADTNTEVIPNMRFTGGSITSEVCCEAARRACLELKKTLEPHATFLRKKKAAEIAEDASKKGQDPEPTWAEVCAAANTVLGHTEKLSATGIFSPQTNKYATDVEGNPIGTSYHGDYFTFGAGCSEVELDVLTGETRILRSDVLFDVGQSLNPGIDIGQIEGAFCFGIGYYMTEEPLFDANGIERSQGVWEYKPPMASEMPREFNVELLRDNPFPKGVLGSKAVGEPPFMLSYSALGAAKKAIESARKDAGLDPKFDLPMPSTVDAIQQACGHKPEHYQV